MKAQEAIKRIKEFGLYHAIGDYYYSDGNTVHKIERMLNPLVCYAGMAGMSTFIGKGFLWNLQNEKDTI